MSTGFGKRLTVGLGELMLAIVVLALVFVAVRELGQPLVLIAVLFLPIVVGGAVASTVVQASMARKEALLAVLGIAAKERLPVDEGVRALAAISGDRYGRQLHGLAQRLRQGVPVADALAERERLLPTGTAFPVVYGWAEGTPQAGVEMAQGLVRGRRLVARLIVPNVVYGAVVLAVLQILGWFLCMFIAPKYQAIFADFGLSLPGPTRVVFRAGYLMTSTVWGFTLALLDVFVLFYVAFALAGWVTWHRALTTWLLGEWDRAAALRALAMTVERGRPLGTALERLAEFHPRAWVRRAATDSLGLIEYGVPWVEALARRGLLRTREVPLIEAAERVGNVAWALRTLADRGERLLEYRLQVAAQLLLPVVVIACGALVALIAVGYFLPLVQMIRLLA